MNDMIETAALVVYRELPPTLTDVYIQQGGVDAVLALIERQAREEAAGLDASRPKDREKIASLARTKIARSKTALLDAGMKLTEDWRASTAKVNAEKRTITERLDRLRDEIRAPLTAWENAEKDRVAAHEKALADLVEEPGWGGVETSDEIALRIHYLENYPACDWQEFKARYTATLAGELDRARAAHAAAVKREAEAAELARLREAEARREAERQEQERIAREARIAAEAAERATRDAEAKAAEEAAAAERRAQAERDAAAKRERDAAEALAKAERDRQDAIDRAERDRLAAEARAKEAEAKAERDRLAAELKAERDRAAAVEAERRRIEADAEAKRQADEARAANLAHRAGINRAALAAIQAVITAHGAGTIIAEEAARAIVTAIAKGEVPHVSVNY